MLNENNDENSNAGQNESTFQRTTISLKRRNVGLSVSGRSHTSKTVEVEVKRKKTSNLMIDLTGNSKATKKIEEEVSWDVSIEDNDEDGIPRKLTDLEFQKRFKVLQDALQNEKEDLFAQDDLEVFSSDQEVIQEEYTEEVISYTEETSINEPQEQTLPKAGGPRRQLRKNPATHVLSGESVVFKSSEYVKKTIKNKTPETKEPKRPSLEKTSQVLLDVPPDPSSISTHTLHQTRTRRNVDIEEKKTSRQQISKRTSFGKKISRVVIDRVLDNDLEERTRSLASFKRARNKLRNNGPKDEEVKVVRDVNIPDVITVSELANRMAVRGADVVKYLMKIGTFATLNQSIDGDTAEVICTEFGHKPKRVSESDIENEIEDDIVDAAEDLLPRAPIVAVMGHVDHGKTTLLDTLRKANVAGKESGGITQHVSSYQVTSSDGRKITFIDTPGHAAFSKIRSIGAVITDIIILVVAADDGIKDQTIEAIAHAKTYNVPIIVAINKIDKPDINIERVKGELMTHELVLEEFGGDVLSAEISALKNTNLNGLIDTILLQAEIMQLQANPSRKAVGTIVESRISKGKGITADAIIQHGTLYPGDIFVAGGAYGKVKTLYDEYGKKLEKAGPSVPVEIVGFNNAPSPGDTIYVMDSEQKAREIAEYRQRVRKDKSLLTETVTIEQMMAGHAAAKIELNILAKADVYGSLEALITSIRAITHDEIEVKVTERGVGMINESDIDFAKYTNSLIVGFNVGITASAKENAKLNNVKVYHNTIIYHIIEEVKNRMGALLPPLIEENYIGRADVRKIFTIARYGTIAGCYVSDGLIKRADSKIKVMRKNDCLFEGKIRSMKHEKDEIKESKQNHECGILAEGYNDFQEGDYIECYEIVQKARTVS